MGKNIGQNIERDKKERPRDRYENICVCARKEPKSLWDRCVWDAGAEDNGPKAWGTGDLRGDHEVAVQRAGGDDVGGQPLPGRGWLD